jgi:transcriptional antiterminator RfaH
MLTQGADNRLHWYAIHTHPKQEDRAESNLKAWRVETFVPRYKQRRYHQYTNNPSQLIKPLFPRYIFARFVASELLHKIHFTRGVHSVVSFGKAPIPIDDELIAIIQARRSEDGFVRIGDEFKAGDHVMVKAGHFKGFTGIFERSLKDADRVMIMLKTVGYQPHIVIEKEYVVKAGGTCPGA